MGTISLTWVSITLAFIWVFYLPPLQIKSQSNIRIFYLPWTEMISLKATGEQTTDDWQPVSQGTHNYIGVKCATSDVKLP